MDFSLKGKKIILGVTGSIAAYKAPLLVRELKKAGAEINILMTPSAKNFVTPMVMANLSQNPVGIEMFDESSQRGGAWHIHSAHECAAMIIAPASATTIGKLANGICDNALVTVATALPKNIPLLIAPAMDFTMLENPATQKNIKQLEDWGAIIIPPDEGELSSGLIGRGRLPDTAVLIEYIKKAIFKGYNVSSEKTTTQETKDIIKETVNKSFFNLQDGVDKTKWQADFELELLKQKIENKDFNVLRNKKVLITAGPTIEKIDDVRFISNFSTGKMGYSLAETCRNAGMNVILVSGRVELKAPENVELIRVESAEEMYNTCIQYKEDYDIAILSAAVADYTPKSKYDGKIKKKIDDFSLELVKTKDILSELGKHKNENQILIGFALESTNEIENGWNKLKDKNCDMIVVNSANKENSGFGGDNNTISILNKKGIREDFSTASKSTCSIYILQSLLKYLNN